MSKFVISTVEITLQCGRFSVNLLYILGTNFHKDTSWELLLPA